MRRFQLILFILSLSFLSAAAQPYRTAAGLRFGFPYGATVRHFFDPNNGIELIAAANFRGFIAAGFFENEYRISRHSGLCWFWGLGLHGGYVDAARNPYLYMKEDYVGPVIGVDAIAGFDYTFRKIPLNISLDLLPSINLGGYTGWNGLSSAISVRYVFFYR